MQPCSSPDIHQKSFRIKHDDDRFFTRLLSKESSTSDPSFGVYYGDVSGAVPFMWETRPGTPKHSYCDETPILPLTPPPSYYAKAFNNSSKKHYSRSKMLLHGFLRRMNLKKPHWAASCSTPSSSPSRSSSSNSLYSDPVATPAYAHRRRRLASWGSSFDRGDMEDRRDEVCPSRLCFGIGKAKRDRRQGRSCSVLMATKALSSIVGLGST